MKEKPGSFYSVEGKDGQAISHINQKTEKDDPNLYNQKQKVKITRDTEEIHRLTQTHLKIYTI